LVLPSFFFSYTFSQSLTSRNFNYRIEQILYDTGFNWKDLSSIGLSRKRTNLNGKSNLGISFNSHKIQLEGMARFYFKNKFYSFIDFQSSPLSVNYIERYNNFKIGNISGFGFLNDWSHVQIGRDCENWGSGNDISIGLSNKSNPYDYFMLGSNYGRVRVNFIYGIMETIDSRIKKYITARGLEWSNQKNLIIGITETVIYSGINRSFDLAYLNPIGSHLEIELNNRLNEVGTHAANAIWQLHFDYFFKNKSRISFNYLIDEFVFDKNIEIGKEHGNALSCKYVFSFFNSKSKIWNMYVSYFKIGTPTFRHGDGANNFVLSGKPLGWQYGSDGNQINFGSTFSNKQKFIYILDFGTVKLGEESILFRPNDPYSDYKKGKFPSGKVKTISYIKFELLFKVKNYLEINFSVAQNKFLYPKNKTQFEIGLYYNFSKFY
tara:strand:+ start:151 stop:1455 length:1305 start_codon:yes stop_codon:yes gene_type:complete